MMKHSAEVIKIENPKGGDDTRAWGPPFAENKDVADAGRGESAYFLCVNRNKKSVTVDMKSPSGRKMLHDLVKECDVLVENYLPGKLSKMGMGYEQLKEINPKLVYASITGYGQTGPYADRPGYDVIIEAEAGLMHITGEPDGSPVKVGVAITGKRKGNTVGLASVIDLFWDRPYHGSVRTQRHSGCIDQAWCHRQGSVDRLLVDRVPGCFVGQHLVQLPCRRP